MQSFDSFSHSSPHNCALTALSFLHVIYTSDTAHTTQTTHTTSNYPCYMPNTFSSRRLHSMQAVRFLVLLFPPIEFFLLSCEMLNMTLNYRAVSTVSLILPSKEPRTGESVWPKPLKSQKSHAVHPNFICLETFGM